MDINSALVIITGIIASIIIIAIIRYKYHHSKFLGPFGTGVEISGHNLPENKQSPIIVLNDVSTPSIPLSSSDKKTATFLAEVAIKQKSDDKFEYFDSTS